jgi:hypothetical protein
LLENVKHGTVLNYILKNFQWQETGTAQANYGTNGGNDKHYISFVGFFLVEHPQYSCIVVVHKVKYIKKIIITQMLPDQFLKELLKKNIYRCSVSE